MVKTYAFLLAGRNILRSSWNNVIASVTQNFTKIIPTVCSNNILPLYLSI